MTNAEPALSVAVEAALAAGEVIRRGLAADEKGAQAKSHPNDPVTVFDRQAEDAIVRLLVASFPEDGILSEESAASDGSSGFRWIVDPIDGTNNFLAGVPHVAVSIARADRHGSVVACIHDPIRRETFTAVRGGGARLGDDRLRVSERATLDGAVLGIGLSHHPTRRARMLAQLPALAHRAGVLRTLGSAALDLAYVAAGRFDAAWYAGLSPWDVAAAALLVEEAGGRITDLEGNPSRDPEEGIAASNGRIHDGLLHALAG